MSISNVDLIADALRELGVIAETETPSAEQGATALRKLNQMLEQWEEDDIKLDGWFVQSSTSDTCPIPSYAEYGIACNLAVRLAATYGATVSPELASCADDGIKTIRRQALNARNKPVSVARQAGEGQMSGYDINQGF